MIYTDDMVASSVEVANPNDLVAIFELRCGLICSEWEKSEERALWKQQLMEYRFGHACWIVRLKMPKERAWWLFPDA